MDYVRKLSEVLKEAFYIIEDLQRAFYKQKTLRKFKKQNTSREIYISIRPQKTFLIKGSLQRAFYKWKNSYGAFNKKKTPERFLQVEVVPTASKNLVMLLRFYGKKIPKEVSKDGRNLRLLQTSSSFISCLLVASVLGPLMDFAKIGKFFSKISI